MPCCDVVNRGAALYDNLVIFATLDAQLVALDQDTGDVVWKEKIDDYKAGYSATAAPIIANGLVLTGVSGGEFGVVGRVEARDAKTGQLVWIAPDRRRPHGLHLRRRRQAEARTASPARPTRPGRATCGRPAAPPPGSAAPTTRKTGLAYFGTGNPAPWNSHLRQGDNLFSCSTVAIDVKTGQIKSGTTRTRPTTAGTSTASTSSSPSTWTASASAARPTATASSTSTTRPPASCSTPSRSSRRSPGPAAST